jgi:hypothetical protein
MYLANAGDAGSCQVDAHVRLMQDEGCAPARIG